VDHSGDGGARAGADVGCGAGDGSGGGDAAEEGRDEVGDALRDQLHVGVVAVAGHAVRDHGGEQAFDRGKHGDGEGRRQEAEDMRGAEVRQRERRKALRDAAEFAADGLDGQMEAAPTARVAAEERDDGAGMRGIRSRGMKRMTASETSATATVCQRMVRCARPGVSCESRNSLGTGGV
jgi:pyruvate/2-oxoglutarate dehydrogenase complex dihydrolipoamide acyltransferase (E2) component